MADVTPVRKALTTLRSVCDRSTSPYSHPALEGIPLLRVAAAKNLAGRTGVPPEVDVAMGMLVCKPTRRQVATGAAEQPDKVMHCLHPPSPPRAGDTVVVGQEVMTASPPAPWSLRRGCKHSQPATGLSPLRECYFVPGQGASALTPNIARRLRLGGCFNGATSFRTWKPCAAKGKVSSATKLQWSH